MMHLRKISRAKLAFVVFSALPSVALGDQNQCELDLPWFRYSALDAITLREGNDAEVAKLLESPDEPSMIQLGLWYAYRHESSARSVFAKADLEKLFEAGGDPARSILYLIYRTQKKSFESVPRPTMDRLGKKMAAWKVTLGREKPSRALLLDVYVDGTKAAANTSVPIDENIDMIWKRGHEYQAAGRLKEAFGEYQRVAEYGNSAALITAAMFAMEAGGEECFARSRLYFGLGGMWGKVQWTSLPGGSPTSRPFEGTTETGDRPL